MTYKEALIQALSEFNVTSEKEIPPENRFDFYMLIEDKMLGHNYEKSNCEQPVHQCAA